jgi:hypothetical protein
MAAQVIEDSKKRHDWEEFSREASAGRAAATLYPLHDEARAEYEAWHSARR